MPSKQFGTTFFGQMRTRYARFGRPISSLSLVGGFVFDALTLKRVDMFWENFWVLMHLLVAAACIILANRAMSSGADEKDPKKKQFWFVNVLQFTFGGLLSTFLVLYFRSGSLWESWPFLLILAAAFVANESLKKHYARVDFQVSFFFLSLFSFAIFIVPVILHVMGPLVFLLSGALSLGLLWLFLRLLKSVSGEAVPRGRKVLLVCIAAIFLTINGLYFLNLIPPIPLSLQDAGVEHSVTRQKGGDENFIVQSEKRSWLDFFRYAQQFHWTPGEKVYAYTAVFSPTSLRTTIVHEWQRYEDKRGWVTVNRIELPLNGGREGGYRTYSVKSEIAPGAWRVNVETPSGALLGRLRFNVVLANSAPELQTEIKD